MNARPSFYDTVIKPAFSEAYGTKTIASTGGTTVLFDGSDESNADMRGSLARLSAGASMPTKASVTHDDNVVRLGLRGDTAGAIAASLARLGAK